MITITRNELDYLVSKGYRWHSDLHKTYSGHKKYYATEDPRLLSTLKKYREEHSTHAN